MKAIRQIVCVAMIATSVVACATTSNWTCNKKTGFCSDTKAAKKAKQDKKDS